VLEPSLPRHHVPFLPTRRSSDLAILRYCYGDERDGPQERQASFVPPLLPYEVITKGVGKLYRLYIPQGLPLELIGQVGNAVTPRSEEHTSELQSRFDIVCGLLLE